MMRCYTHWMNQSCSHKAELKKPDTGVYTISFIQRFLHFIIGVWYLSTFLKLIKIYLCLYHQQQNHLILIIRGEKKVPISSSSSIECSFVVVGGSHPRSCTKADWSHLWCTLRAAQCFRARPLHTTQQLHRNTCVRSISRRYRNTLPSAATVICKQWEEVNSQF